jgi:ketosteroid isomerase-like protein
MPASSSPSRTALTTAALAGAAAAAGARAVYLGATRALLRRNAAALMAGDPGPLLRMYAPDAALVFPGRHSWARTYRGKPEIEAFLRRFLATGLRGEVGAIFVDGPPWATHVAVEFEDWIDEDGTRIYENRAMLVCQLRWGRVIHEELYEDTQKVAELDGRQAAAAPTPATTAVA